MHFKNQLYSFKSIFYITSSTVQWHLYQININDRQLEFVGKQFNVSLLVTLDLKVMYVTILYYFPPPQIYWYACC